MTKEAGFAELYTAHYRQVRGLCRQLLGSADRAEDAAQEAFVRAYRALASYDPAQPFVGWIMSIARNHCLDLLRRRSTEVALFGNEAEEAAPAEAPERRRSRRRARRRSAPPPSTPPSRSCPSATACPLALAYYADADYDEIASNARHHAQPRRRAALPRQATAAPIARGRLDATQAGALPRNP